MRKVTLLMLAVAPVCLAETTVEIKVKNPASFPRVNEIVEVDESAVKSRLVTPSFILTDVEGNEVAWQSTHDGKIIFPADVPAAGEAVYVARSGVASPVEPRVYGRLFRERADDMTWENEHSAYRAYGPALQKNGERGFGYDVWTKSVGYPVIEKRYYLNNFEGISFHKDHGEGMDPYTVGPTLGGGTAALLVGDDILYPWCFTDFEVLDNGPLRFCVKLDYPAMTAEKGNPAHETRIITLDSGDWLNRTEVIWNGLKEPQDVLAAQVVHRQNPDGYVIDPENNVAGYADLTDNPDAGNGIIFVGTVAVDDAMPVYLPLKAPEGDAIGHVGLRGTASDNKPFVYYWGSGWSKGGMENMDKWMETLRRKRLAIQNPLETTVTYIKVD